MKRFVFFLLGVSLLFGYDLVLKNKDDVEKLNDIGILCKKSSVGYVCISSYDREKLEKLRSYLEKVLGIESFIYDEKSKVVDQSKLLLPSKKPQNIKNEVKNRQKSKKTTKLVKNGYCIQTVSSKKLSYVEKEFKKYKSFPHSRIEKIKGYYVIRIGQQKRAGSLKNLLKNVKSVSKDAFVRKCDYIPQRIVKKGD